jgi:hypothetical protein
MIKFRLVQRTMNKFQVLSGEDVVGSICVEPSQVPDLLKHFVGEKQLLSSPRMSVPTMRFKPTARLSRQALLRSSW